jgi:ribosomal protein S18 acetylase RimI-like enzyme
MGALTPHVRDERVDHPQFQPGDRLIEELGELDVPESAPIVLSDLDDYERRSHCHGNGVGSKLLEALLTEVDRNHGSSQYVWAYVHPDNEPSQGLFEKYGFTRREPATEDADTIRLLQRY